MSTLTIDLTTLACWSSLINGQHTLQVKSMGNGYRDSNISNTVNFTKVPNEDEGGK